MKVYHFYDSSTTPDIDVKVTTDEIGTHARCNILEVRGLNSASEAVGINESTFKQQEYDPRQFVVVATAANVTLITTGSPGSTNTTLFTKV